MEAMLDPGKKYFVIWEGRRLGYFLNGEYFDRKDNLSGLIKENGEVQTHGTSGVATEDSFVRRDGTQFKLIAEDDPKLVKTNPAHGGSI
jgi:hypothetical protein